jgi:hypothetical protein
MTVSTAALVGCATTETAGGGGKTHIDDSRLTGLSVNQLSPVTEQQQLLDKAERDLESARQTQQETESRIRLALTEHDVSEAQLGQAKTEADLTKKNLKQLADTGVDAGQIKAMASTNDLRAQQEKVATANRDVEEAQLRLKAVNAKIDYLKSLDQVAKRTITYDEKSIGLQRAKLEQAKYQALLGAHPGQAKSLSVRQADYDALIARNEAEVANANSDWARKRAEATEKYQVWIAADEKSGHKPIAPEAASVPPPPKG